MAECVIWRPYAAAGLVAVMDGTEVGPFNLGNPTEFTMLQLAELVKEVVNPQAEIVFKENTPDDPSRRKPDITKVRALQPMTVVWPAPFGCDVSTGIDSDWQACKVKGIEARFWDGIFKRGRDGCVHAGEGTVRLGAQGGLEGGASPYGG